jgi:hypothetical protein
MFHGVGWSFMSTPSARADDAQSDTRAMTRVARKISVTNMIGSLFSDGLNAKTVSVSITAESVF